MTALRRYFTFHSSNYLTLSIVFAHIVVMLALFFVPIHPIGLTALFAVLVLSMVYFMLRDARLRLPTAWCAMRLDEDGSVVLIDRQGGERVGRLSRRSVVMPYLVVLNVMTANSRARCNVVLASDSMDAESFRQLRVMLKWGVASV